MSLISVEAAAGILGVSRRTAYRYADEKLIPVVRFKKTIRVHKEKLEQMLEEEAAASMRDASAYRRKYAVQEKRLRLLVDLFQISNRKAC
ncbi:helix-turn-helix domain-containing protein [Pseudomonas aeruginosa]|uniref:helix-turn-helix domain-containing protein n=1 Tax=Pseudomonas aeruginosa TaxID=287 RepID=UPI000E074D29|nr:helix-turn-helix domain-containing protein [Pseudomonas aeruginosa]SUC63792.1 DNA binding domain, excisionase family [Pseudomonas aeruginosa]